jgi:hypothetical protein
MLDLRRRQFITLLGGAAVAWPLAARAQQPERMRRIGVLNNIAADDPDAPVRVAALAQGLQELGWTIGRSLRIEYRWSAGDADRIRRYAAGISSSVTGPHDRVRRCARGRCATGGPYCANRIPFGERSGRGWLGRELGEARRDCHGFH